MEYIFGEMSFGFIPNKPLNNKQKRNSINFFANRITKIDENQV